LADNGFSTRCGSVTAFFLPLPALKGLENRPRLVFGCCSDARGDSFSGPMRRPPIWGASPGQNNEYRQHKNPAAIED